MNVFRKIRDYIRQFRQMFRIVRREHMQGKLSPDKDMEDRLLDLNETVKYLEYQCSRLSSIVRYLAAPLIHELPTIQQTRQSFDFQWNKIPEGRFMLSNKEFRKEAPAYVCEFTGLPEGWFKDKKVIDVGCGQGRYSWALCKLGAEVMSVDQSEHGLARTAEA